LELVFWIALGLIICTYFGYPILLFCLRPFLKTPVSRGPITPKVTLIIAAHNEVNNIREKIENSQSLDYPKERFQIIVASDFSTDGTDEIVKEYQHEGVLLVRLNKRGGKTKAQNEAVKMATGDIFVFSDAPTLYRPDAISKLVRNYADPMVGFVTGEVIYTNDKNSLIGEGGSLYWKYESWIKQMESDIGSILGAAGCIYSIRRELYVPFEDEDLMSDFLSALKIKLRNVDEDFLLPLSIKSSGFGSRAVMDPEAISIEKVSDTTWDEFRMRARVITRAMVGLYRMREILNPLKYGILIGSTNRRKSISLRFQCKGISHTPNNCSFLINKVIYFSGSFNHGEGHILGPGAITPQVTQHKNAYKCRPNPFWP